MYNKVKGSTIFITGGAGFIGSHLTNELLERGYSVKVVDNLANGNLRNLEQALKNPQFEFVEADILDLKKIMKEMEGMDYVYHLACLGVRHSVHSPIENHRVNTEGTINLLEASRKNKIKKFFYISSSEVYGEAKSFPLDENSLTFPTTIYGSSKLAGENYTLSYKHFGLDAVVFRIFNNFGPNSHYEGDAGEVIPRTIVALLYGQSPIIFGNGLITRDFFYVKDTTRALSDFLELKNTSHEIINVGMGRETTIKELLQKIVEIINPSIPIRYTSARPADVPRLWVNASKFYQLTNFNPSYNLESGLVETIKYFKILKEKEELISQIKVKNWEKINE